MVVLDFRPSVKQRLEDERILLIEEKLLELEQELRALRGAVAELRRCTCPTGFGAVRDPNCRRHRGE